MIPISWFRVTTKYTPPHKMKSIWLLVILIEKMIKMMKHLFLAKVATIEGILSLFH